MGQHYLFCVVGIIYLGNGFSGGEEKPF